MDFDFSIELNRENLLQIHNINRHAAAFHTAQNISTARGQDLLKFHPLCCYRIPLFTLENPLPVNISEQLCLSPCRRFRILQYILSSLESPFDMERFLLLCMKGQFCEPDAIGLARTSLTDLPTLSHNRKHVLSPIATIRKCKLNLVATGNNANNHSHILILAAVQKDKINVSSTSPWLMYRDN